MSENEVFKRKRFRIRGQKSIKKRDIIHLKLKSGQMRVEIPLPTILRGRLIRNVDHRISKGILELTKI